MARPLVGICAAVEQARFGPWDEFAVLIQRSYADSIQAAGGIAVVMAPDAGIADDPAQLLDRIDALVLAGGLDIGLDPARDGFELALARGAIDRGMPVLGVCRGVEALNVARGGTLIEHVPDAVGSERHLPQPGIFAEHEVRLQPGSLAARAAGAERLTVNSHHHQGIESLGDGLIASGWSADDELVEAIELSGAGFGLGVLWHPEVDPDDQLIPAFVKAAS